MIAPISRTVITHIKISIKMSFYLDASQKHLWDDKMGFLDAKRLDRLNNDVQHYLNVYHQGL